jgi:hypothetical protein
MNSVDNKTAGKWQGGRFLTCKTLQTSLPASLLFFLWMEGFAQSEKKIKKEKVPANIQNYIKKNYPDGHKIRYFKEQHQDTVLYVARLRTKKERLVMEFFENGELYEIEREEEFENLPASTQAAIQKDLVSRFHQFHILKVEFVNPHMKTEHELTIKAKTEQGTQFLEVFYDEHGSFIRMSELKLKAIQTMF